MNTRLACILGILVLASSGAARGQSEPAQRGVETSVAGTVISSSGTSLVIRTDAGAEQSFDVDANSLMPAAVLPGNRISVSYHVLDNGRRHVDSVMRSDVPQESAPAAPSTTPVATPAAPAPTMGLTTLAAPASAPSTLLPPPTTPDLPPAVPEPPMPAVAGADERLPDTASELPLLALAGVMTIAAGLVLRELRRRDA